MCTSSARAENVPQGEKKHQHGPSTSCVALFSSPAYIVTDTPHSSLFLLAWTIFHVSTLRLRAQVLLLGATGLSCLAAFLRARHCPPAPPSRNTVALPSRPIFSISPPNLVSNHIIAQSSPANLRCDACPRLIHVTPPARPPPHAPNRRHPPHLPAPLAVSPGRSAVTPFPVSPTQLAIAADKTIPPCFPTSRQRHHCQSSAFTPQNLSSPDSARPARTEKPGLPRAIPHSTCAHTETRESA